MKAWGYSELERAAKAAGLKILHFSNRNIPTVPGDSDEFWRFISVLEKIV